MMTDLIADMLTRIRNASQARHESVIVPSSRLKLKIAKILEEEGFVGAVESVTQDKRAVIVIKLKYSALGKEQFNEIVKNSRSGRRVYLAKDEIKPVRYGRGISILSTSKGVMKDADAKKLGVGGELLCTLW